MRIQIRESGREAEACITCGSTRLLRVPATNADLERDILEMLDAVTDAPWWRPFLRREQRFMRQFIIDACAELRKETVQI